MSPASREVKRVELTSRPDLVLYVRALNAFEAMELATKLKDANDTKTLVTEQLAAFVCDEHGTQKFTTAEATTEFLKTIKQGVVSKLLKAATAFNNLTDEAIEEELKN